MEQENKISSKKSSNLLILLIFTVVSVMLFFVIYYSLDIKNQLNELKNIENDIPVFENKNENTENENIVIEQTTIYSLKDYNGKIGIYKDDALVYTIDKFIFTLPEKDKKLLKEGIYTTNIQEFYEILEQYYWFLKTTESSPSNDFKASIIDSLTSIEISDAFIYFFWEIS